MPEPIKIDNHIWKATIHANQSIDTYPHLNRAPSEHRLSDVMTAAGALHSHTPLSRVRWKVKGGQPTVFDLTVDAADGREWKQTVEMATYGTPDGVGVKFDVRDDYWYLPEFSLLQNLRVSVVYLTNMYEVTDFDIQFI